MRLAAVGRLVVAAALVLSLPWSVSAQCFPEQQDMSCGVQCTWLAPNVWSCSTPSNPQRACWALFTSTCGEASPYECCGGGQGGF
jgi:hypothetical protein